MAVGAYSRGRVGYLKILVSVVRLRPWPPFYLQILTSHVFVLSIGFSDEVNLYFCYIFGRQRIKWGFLIVLKQRPRWSG